MPTADQQNLLGECLGLCSDAGNGKTSFAMQGPQPIAMFCMDKAAHGTLPPNFPGYDPRLTFYTAYLPPDVDLTKDTMERDRTMFDKAKRDIQNIRDALKAKKPEFTLQSEKETWPLPKTIIFEGGDFLKSGLIDHYLRRHSKTSMSEFEGAAMSRWGDIGKEMVQILGDLTKLPAYHSVNVVVTLGWDHENEGKERTGFFVPDFGGKLDTLGPRMFKDFWMPVSENGKFYMITSSTTRYTKYKGIRCGRFGLKAIEDVTLIPDKPVNQWNRLFGTPIAT